VIKAVKDLTHEDGTECDGICNPTTRTISLKHGLSKEDKAKTFIHELMHAVWFESHITNDDIKLDFIEELLCESTSDILTSLFDLKWRK